MNLTYTWLCIHAAFSNYLHIETIGSITLLLQNINLFKKMMPLTALKFLKDHGLDWENGVNLLIFDILVWNGCDIELCNHLAPMPLLCFIILRNVKGLSYNQYGVNEWWISVDLLCTQTYIICCALTLK